jgi:tartrate-resistant acid phosphatase type 5
VQSDQDPLWRIVFEDRFGAIDLPWYAVLGNHDHLGVAAAQVSSCTALGCPDLPANWNMPAFNYSLVRQAGPGSTLQLVFIDTWQLANEYSQALLRPAGASLRDEPRQSGQALVKAEQHRWIEETLRRSKADWLVVVGHYPVFSGGEHGETPELQSFLRPLLEKYQVDMYLCGHGACRLLPASSLMLGRCRVLVLRRRVGRAHG